MSELQWFPWGRNSYTTTWPPKSGRWYRLVPGLDGWGIYRKLPGRSGLQFWQQLPKMRDTHAKQAAALLVTMGGGSE